MIKRIISIMLVLLLSFNIVYGNAITSGNEMTSITLSELTPSEPLTGVLIVVVEFVRNCALVVMGITIVVSGIIAYKMKSEDKDIKHQKLIIYTCIIIAIIIYIFVELFKWWLLTYSY